MRLVWTQPALRDLEDIGDYIAADNSRAAQRILNTIVKRVSTLQDFPHLGRIGHWDGTRELIVSGSPYIVPYRLQENHIEILAVFHSARQWPGKLSFF